MSESSQPSIESPVVFISYSHDNPQHKRWVTSLAEQLITQGHIDVKIDCWDTNVGDDLGFFMEHSVTNSQRVLLICSEIYSQKVDDGVGGAGYEGGIVRSELIGKVGTSKFIPVIPPGNDTHRVPICVRGKKYIDMTNGDDFQEGIQELIISIRDYTPVLKPKLGFSEQFQEIENLKRNLPRQGNMTIEEGVPENPIECYNHARSILLSEDIPTWKNYLKQQRDFFFAGLMKYRAEHEKKRYDNDDAIKMVKEAASSSQCLLATVCAGIESEREKYRHHVALIADILRPTRWNDAGIVIFASLPKAMTFIFHYMIGAFAIKTRQFDLAFENANFKIVNERYVSSLALSPIANGFEESYGNSFVSGVKILHSLFNEWSFLSRSFDDVSDYIASITVYNILLILGSFAHKPDTTLKEQNAAWAWGIPPIFLFTQDYNTRRLAKQKLMTDSQQILSFLNTKQISPNVIIACWNNYIDAWKHGNGMMQYYLDAAYEDFKGFFTDFF